MNNALLTSTPPPPATAGRVRLKADVLKAHRHRLGLSQEAFAIACFERQLCVSIASVKRAETGKPLLLRTARHLAAFYSIDVHSLLLSQDELAGHDEDGADDAVPDAASDAASQAEAVAPERSSMAWLDGRWVQVLCMWPSTEQARIDMKAALSAEGATMLPSSSADEILAVFGLPRAQRSDVARCAKVALQWSRHRALVCGGMWLNDALAWPHHEVKDWLNAQAAGAYVHRSMFGRLRGLHHVEHTGHADVGRLGLAHRPLRRQLKLAGRRHEMRLFASLLNTVLADQQSQVLTVQGMAGLGKSRLLAEMMDKAQQQFMATVLVEIQDFGGDSHRAVFTALLKGLLDVQDATPFWDQLVSQRLRHFSLPPEQMLLCKDLLGMHMSVDERGVLQAMGHAARSQGVVQLLARMLTRMALQRPLLLVIEDVHWASASTVETLARVMSASQESQILWALSSRVEAPQRASELQRLIPDVAVTSLSLAPLRMPEVQDLAQQYSHVDEAWRAQCVQRAQGHPLFLTQLLLADRQSQLPDNFQHLLQVRLDEVSPQDRHVLRLAAVIGQPFSREDIQQLMGEPSYPLDALVQHCLLRHVDGDRYDFSHALIRQGLYEALPVRQKEAMHEQVAAYFDATDKPLSAQHWHRARHPGAPQALLGAARALQAVFDHEAALSLLNSYGEIDYAPRDPYAHATALGEAHAKMGQMNQARQAYERARRCAPDDVSRLKAIVALAGVLNVLEDLAAEEGLINQAWPLAVQTAMQTGAQASLAALHYLKGNLYFPRGDVAQSRMHHNHAMDLARQAGEVRLQAQALSGLGDSYYAEGLMSTAHDHFLRCLQLCDAHGLRDIEASNRFMLATTQIYLCQTASALTHAQASAELARRVGNRRAEIVSRLTASWVLLGQGQAREALLHIDQGLINSRAIGALRFESFLQEAQARALWALGDELSAQRTIESALEGVERLKLHAFIGPWVMGTWALLHHQDARSLHMLQRAAEQVQQGCVAHNIYRFHACAMEVHVLAGRYDAALRIGQAWLQRTGHEPTPWVQGLYEFMAACCAADGPPTSSHQAWRALQDRQMLHVLLKLPQALSS